MSHRTLDDSEHNRLADSDQQHCNGSGLRNIVIHLGGDKPTSVYVSICPFFANDQNPSRENVFVKQNDVSYWKFEYALSSSVVTRRHI
ncbi:hypothetical protein T265_05009 [Opisthorchis viverrini]|uniref:Uncharacterized protein n=1 Tax=Opisthorchis viverrini TaxID=6198 RepID=A0A074ZL70_OPIVI|nr:hypothetical protein T265_05009 [Opisthorchis viverrini]KER28098.1 hypothetical protein T265_05009 [Opisthorchis viverrini]